MEICSLKKWSSAVSRCMVQSFSLSIFFAEGIFETLDTTWKYNRLNNMLFAGGVLGFSNGISRKFSTRIWSENYWNIRGDITKILDNLVSGSFYVFAKHGGFHKNFSFGTFKKCVCRGRMFQKLLELALSKLFGLCNASIKIGVSQCRKTQ